ncbi:hypothetical protein EI94DRAFT_1746250 [Lactarius quietus]|nr:hypothetical protein EI94DRAFT_1746250 [Lactarius quietus]
MIPFNARCCFHPNGTRRVSPPSFTISAPKCKVEIVRTFWAHLEGYRCSNETGITLSTNWAHPNCALWASKPLGAHLLRKTSVT